MAGIYLLFSPILNLGLENINKKNINKWLTIIHLLDFWTNGLSSGEAGNLFKLERTR